MKPGREVRTAGRRWHVTLNRAFSRVLLKTRRLSDDFKKVKERVMQNSERMWLQERDQGVPRAPGPSVPVGAGNSRSVWTRCS